MTFFNLPNQTQVNKSIPKNAFDTFTNSKQKKLISDVVQKITWTNKISTETINLLAKDILEIQVFKVELKEKNDIRKIQKILEIIDKVIPYHIVFWVQIGNESYISTSSKHPHPTNENISVIDWNFSTDWFVVNENPYQFVLRNSIDAIYKDFCVQITGQQELSSKPLEHILENQKNIDTLKKEIASLRSRISSKRIQFNEKVELNLRLNKIKKELEKLMLSSGM